ncbi:hypothetical protein ACLEPN_41965, partial [Myxococcus sp. 1LA]
MGSQSVVTQRPPWAKRSRWLAAAMLVSVALAGCKEEQGATPPAAPQSQAPVAAQPVDSGMVAVAQP